MTQSKRILKHLIEKQTITSMEAYDLYGITRLSARIHDLRDVGYPVVMKKKSAVNRYGKSTTFAEYSLSHAVEESVLAD